MTKMQTFKSFEVSPVIMIDEAYGVIPFGNGATKVMFEAVEPGHPHIYAYGVYGRTRDGEACHICDCYDEDVASAVRYALKRMYGTWLIDGKEES